MVANQQTGRHPVPTIAGRRELLVAMVVDSLGTGLFVPFSVVYFLHTTTLPLASIGASLSIGALLALPTPLLAGRMIDHIGAARLTAVGNLLSAAGVAAYLFANSAWELIAGALTVSVGIGVFGTASRSLVGMIARSAEGRAAWFALQNRMRNLGYGVGGLFGAAAVTTVSRWGYFAIAAGDAATYVVAATLLLHWRARARIIDRGLLPDAPTTTASPSSDHQSYFRLVRSCPLLTLCAVNIMFVLCQLSLPVLLAVFIARVLHAALWLTGALFTFNCLLVASTQGMTTRLTSHHRAASVLTLGAGCFAAAFATFCALPSAARWLIIPVLIAAVGVYTLGEMLVGPTINTLALSMAPVARPGRYVATFSFSWAVGGVVAPGLLTSLLVKGVALPWLALIAACGVAACSVHFVVPAQPELPRAGPRATPPSVTHDSS